MRKRIVRFLAVMLFAGGSMLLASCGGPTPAETADTFLQAVRTGDQSTLSTVYAGSSFSILPEGNHVEDLGSFVPADTDEKMLDFDYRVLETEKDGRQATVEVEILTYPFGDALRDTMEECISEGLLLALSGASDEELQTLISGTSAKYFGSLEEKSYQETVTLKLEKKEGVWIVSEIPDGDPVQNALSGNLQNTVKELKQNLKNLEEETAA